MKNNDRTAIKLDPLLGQILRPVAAQSLKTKALDSYPTCTPQNSPSYRLEKLISQQAGKRTFLAIETHSKTKFVVELVLFGPDFSKETIQPPVDKFRTPLCSANASQNPTLALEQQPYLNSFEVETSIGAGFAMVQPYPGNIHAISALRNIVSSRPVSRKDPTVDLTTPVSSPLTAEPYQLNLSLPYRRHYTRTPQMSFGDFKIRTTPDQLEIHCAQHRIRENLAQTPVPALGGIELGALTVLLTVVFVGGSVALSGSIFLGILIAAVLPIPLRLVAFPPPQVTNRKAILRLTKSENRSKYPARLSLTTLPRQQRKLTAWGTVPPTESKLHFSQVTVSAVKQSLVLSLSSKTGFICYQVSFLMSDRYPLNHRPNLKQLRITGTYSEIRWLSHHLSQWSGHRTR